MKTLWEVWRNCRKIWRNSEIILRRLYRNVNAKHLKKVWGNLKLFSKIFKILWENLQFAKIIVYYYVFRSFCTQYGGWSYTGVLDSLPSLTLSANVGSQLRQNDLMQKKKRNCNIPKIKNELNTYYHWRLQ